MDTQALLGGPERIIAGIVEEFRWLSRFPHPSLGEGALAQALEARLAARGLSPRRDRWNNLCCDLPATPGRAGAPRLILQGHLDMVCAVRPGSGFDPAGHPVTVLTRSGLLCTDGRSSLGADNNLGNAAVLWLLEQDIPHGPLRLIFTAAEEVGLQGAARMAPAWLEGARYLLNTDGFRLGRLVVSSAGGRRETYTRPLERVPARYPLGRRLSLTGGAGGHSGEDIHRGRANAIQLLAGLLEALGRQTDYELAALEGGAAHNAIPAGASALVCLPQGSADLPAALSGAWAGLQAQYARTDPQLTLSCTPVPVPAQAWSQSCRDHTLALLGGLFTGVYAPHPWAEGITGASANLGRVSVGEEGVQVCAFLRCTRKEDALALAARHDGAAAAHGFAGRFNAYPGWPGRPDSPLAHTLAAVYRQTAGRAAEITAVHVGLEPSMFYEKNPALDMVCAGPDIWDAHSVDERAPLDSLPAYAALLAGTLDAVSRTAAPK